MIFFTVNFNMIRYDIKNKRKCELILIISPAIIKKQK